jgi:hypothetical protein
MKITFFGGYMQKLVKNILIIDRFLKEGEILENMVCPYQWTKYDIVIFPSVKKAKMSARIFFFGYYIRCIFEALFLIHPVHNKKGHYYELNFNTAEDVIYNILAEEFEITISNLTEIEGK